MSLSKFQVKNIYNLICGTFIYTIEFNSLTDTALSYQHIVSFNLSVSDAISFSTNIL